MILITALTPNRPAPIAGFAIGAGPDKSLSYNGGGSRRRTREQSTTKVTLPRGSAGDVDVSPLLATAGRGLAIVWSPAVQLALLDRVWWRSRPRTLSRRQRLRQ